MGDVIAGLLLLCVGFGVYFLPLIVAVHRKHRQVAAIAVLNIFAGWTVFLWLGALVWALMEEAPRHD